MVFDSPPSPASSRVSNVCDSVYASRMSSSSEIPARLQHIESQLEALCASLHGRQALIVHAACDLDTCAASAFTVLFLSLCCCGLDCFALMSCFRFAQASSFVPGPSCDAVDRACLGAREEAFKQRIDDYQRAIELLEEGLQHGECVPNPDQLRVLQKLTERSYKTCMVAHHEHFMPVRWPQKGDFVYSKGQYSQETYQKALDIVNNSMWPEFPAQGPALMYACRGPFHRWDRTQTLEMASILMAALEIARDQGRFERLERACFEM